jgi:hypothetical protein
MQLAASACKNWMRLAASRIQIAPTWPLVACNMNKIHGNLPATGRHRGTICMRLAATRVQFECNWRPIGYNLNTTGRQSHAFLYAIGGHSGTLLYRAVLAIRTEDLI